MKINNVYAKVKIIMDINPEARDNDGLLTALVDKSINPAVGSLPYEKVMSNRAAYGLPSCETIRRARQKAQETTPGLSSSRRIKKLREQHQEEVEDFVRTAR